MFYKIASEWLNKKNVPVSGEAKFRLEDGTEKIIQFEGTIDFTQVQPILNMHIRDEIRRYPVAIAKVMERKLQCFYFQPDNPKRYVFFSIEEAV